LKEKDKEENVEKPSSSSSGKKPPPKKKPAPGAPPVHGDCDPDPNTNPVFFLHCIINKVQKPTIRPMGLIEEKSETMHITNKIEWPPKNDNPRTIQRYLQGEPISITIDDDTLPMEGMIIIMDDAETEAQKIQRLENELDALLEDDAPYGKERFADVSVEMENIIKSEKCT
jgi:hypothetical protein